MLSSPPNSTPFSVKDILNLEHQQANFFSENFPESTEFSNPYGKPVRSSNEFGLKLNFRPVSTCAQNGDIDPESLMVGGVGNMASHAETKAEFPKHPDISTDFPYIADMSPDTYANNMGHNSTKVENSTNFMSFQPEAINSTDIRQHQRTPTGDQYRHDYSNNGRGGTPTTTGFNAYNMTHGPSSVPQAQPNESKSENCINIRKTPETGPIPSPGDENYRYDPISSESSVNNLEHANHQANYLSSSPPISTSAGFLNGMGYPTPYSNSSPIDQQRIQEATYPYVHPRQSYQSNPNTHSAQHLSQHGDPNHFDRLSFGQVRHPSPMSNHPREGSPTGSQYYNQTHVGSEVGSVDDVIDPTGHSDLVETVMTSTNYSRDQNFQINTNPSDNETSVSQFHPNHNYGEDVNKVTASRNTYTQLSSSERNKSLDSDTAGLPDDINGHNEGKETLLRLYSKKLENMMEKMSKIYVIC